MPKLPPFLRAAFEYGDQICQQEGRGYLLHLNTKTGEKFTFGPTDGADETERRGYLADDDGTFFLPFDAVAFCTVEEV